MARQSTGGTLDSSREKIIFFRWVGLYLKESSLEVNEIGLSEGNLLKELSGFHNIKVLYLLMTCKVSLVAMSCSVVSGAKWGSHGLGWFATLVSCDLFMLRWYNEGNLLHSMFGILTLGSQLVELKKMVKLLDDEQIWWVSLILVSTKITKYCSKFL